MSGEAMRGAALAAQGEREGCIVRTSVLGIVAQDPAVLGVYDLVLHSYGPEWLVAAVGIYACNSGSEASRMRNEATRIALSHDHVMQVHGFHVDEERHLMTFDVVVSFESPDRRATCEQVCQEVQQAFPDYQVYVTLDTDVSD